MANIVRKWKRWSAVSCSHGHLIDTESAKAYLAFNKEFQPHSRFHLGDFVDLAALRGGADHGPDSAKDVNEDFQMGLDFLEAMQPTTVWLGNHEQRLYELRESPSALKASLASRVISELEDKIRSMKATLVPYDILKGWRKFGSALFGHGYMFSENAIRDHAEMLGMDCVIGHLHYAGEQGGRNLNHSTGYCVGLMADIEQMHYARRRRATMRWSNGYAWGEYCDNETIIRIEKRCKNGQWRNPLKTR